MQELTKHKRLQHPTTPPPRPGPHLLRLTVRTLLPTPDHAPFLGAVPPELERPESSVYRRRHPQLLRRVDPQREAGQGCANGRGVGGGQRVRRAWVAQSEGRRGGVEEVRPQAREEPEEEPVQEEDGAEGK